MTGSHEGHDPLSTMRELTSAIATLLLRLGRRNGPRKSLPHGHSAAVGRSNTGKPVLTAAVSPE